MSLGALGYVGYAEESTDGTFISAPTNYLPVTNFSFEDTNDFIVPDQIRHSRDHYIAMAAPYNVSGSMEMELIPTDVRKLLKSAWAASVATSAIQAVATSTSSLLLQLSRPSRSNPRLLTSS
jgi:hypothetical protein